MARRIVHQLVDDIDGSVMGIGEGESIHFSLNGTAYEIDLTTKNADALRTALEPYIAAGRRASTASASRGSAPRKRTGTSPEIAEIRAWAQTNGHAVSERGRIPAAVVDAYRAAH
ncbi:MAG: histone-like nucleoid-structuring protein Lsr2 [Microbacterium sp.]|uniref:histone-like nucleoid-structuring protein Lsr2 n=1 Tax=Microbacterium sp. TaxID=51671 RepID=UPI003F9D02FD